MAPQVLLSVVLNVVAFSITEAVHQQYNSSTVTMPKHPSGASAADASMLAILCVSTAWPRLNGERSNTQCRAAFVAAECGRTTGSVHHYKVLIVPLLWLSAGLQVCNQHSIWCCAQHTASSLWEAGPTGCQPLPPPQAPAWRLHFHHQLQLSQHSQQYGGQALLGDATAVMDITRERLGR